MKVKSKVRRVQAQRKFAQGAFVPPSSNVPERKRDVTPKDDSANRVVQKTVVKMSAKDLLDMVAFRSMHGHRQPFVLLERLPESSAENILRSEIRDKPPENNNSNTLNESPVAPKIQKSLRPKPLKVKALHTMKLRSQKTQNSLKPLKNNKRKHTNIEVSTVRSKRRRMSLKSSSMTEFSVDDYKPLTYFAKRRQPPGTTPRRVQSSPKQSLAKPKPVTAPPSALVENSSKRVQSEKPAPSPSTPSTPETTTRPRDESPSEELLSSISLAMDRGVISHEELSEFSNGTANDLNKKLTDNGVTPIDRTQASSLLKKLKDPYYSSSQIARWVVACHQSKKNTQHEIATELFKAPLPPPPSQLNKRLERPSSDVAIRDGLISDNISVQSYIEASDCPSVKYITVKDVIEAPGDELARRCKKCRPCSRVAKIPTLIVLASKPYKKHRIRDTEVYEFTCIDEEDTSNTRVTRYRGRRSKVTKSVSQTEQCSSLYLDLLPKNSRHIIQIMTETNFNRVLRACVIPRNPAITTNDLSLIDHESFLDQLMILLRTNNIRLRLATDVEPFASTSQDTGETQETPETHESQEAQDTPETQGDESEPDAPVSAESNIKNESQEEINDNNCEEQLPKVENMPYILIDDASEEDNSNEPNVYFNNPIIQGHYIPPTRRNSTASTTLLPNLPSTSHLEEETSSQANNLTFPEVIENPRIVDAPVFYPTDEEFLDPISYFEKIMPSAAKFGLCKIVAPTGFEPPCNSNEEIRFNVMNQYVARMYTRWGPAQREMCAIKAYLATQSVVFTRPPRLDGMEVDLPKLYHVVQHIGGLKKVIEKNRWPRVADEMRLSRCMTGSKKLDFIYVKYLLPYGTLSNHERQEMIRKVERRWYKKNQKMLDRAINPLHRQKKLLGESDSSADEEEEEEENVSVALMEAEDCVVQGRPMNLATFRKTAANMIIMQFPPSDVPPSPSEVELEYWKIVLLGTNHVCVNSASIDTGNEGYGFPKNKNDPYGKHPWNLKILSQNPGNVLRSLGAVLGVTVPTLHLGMLFSTSCWHRDPHGLPWIEYMHSGPGKIWYGIADEQSENFRQAVEKLCPTSCQNKSIWLPSDIAMIPPRLLCENNVSLSRVTQEPGQFIIVFPKAYSCSISTGFTISESVYFATNAWLNSVQHVFQEVRESCEPTMFSLEHLLVNAARDSRVSLSVLQQVHAQLQPIIEAELANREALIKKGILVNATELRPGMRKPRRPAGAWNVREQDECEICRTTLYFSKVTNLVGKRTCVCLSHALQLLSLPKYSDVDLSFSELVVLFSCSDLENIVKNMQKKLSNEK